MSTPGRNIYKWQKPGYPSVKIEQLSKRKAKKYNFVARKITESRVQRQAKKKNQLRIVGSDMATQQPTILAIEYHASNERRDEHITGKTSGRLFLSLFHLYFHIFSCCREGKWSVGRSDAGMVCGSEA